MKTRKPKAPPHPKLYHIVTKYHEKINWRGCDFNEQLTLRKPGWLKRRLDGQNNFYNRWHIHCVELYSGEVVASNFDLPQATWYQVTEFPMRDAALRGEHNNAEVNYLRKRLDLVQRQLVAAEARANRIAGRGKQISEAREKQLAEDRSGECSAYGRTGKTKTNRYNNERVEP